ncbi:MAG: hypothetical protein M1275_00025 [Patescibacteria group bacterium]|nr:hypothetical protein [Patescibacteria group bacterium]
MDNQPSSQLFEMVMARLDRERSLSALRRRLVIANIFLAVCFVGAIPLFRAAVLEFSRSGFMQYLSLLFSDFKAVSVYWQDLALSLAESLPVISLASALGLLALMGLLLRMISHYQELIAEATRHKLPHAN